MKKSIVIILVMGVQGLAGGLFAGWIREYPEDPFYRAIDVTPVSSGGYAWIGDSVGFSATEIHLVRTDSIGNIIWRIHCGGRETPMVSAIDTTGDGGFIVVGADNFSFDADTVDILIVRTDSLGTILWTRTFGGEYRDGANHVTITSRGNFLISGYVGVSDSPYSEGCLINIDSDGDTNWLRTYDEFRELAYVIETLDGNYVALNGAEFVKVNEDGDIIWTEDFDMPFDTDYLEIFSFDQTLDRGYIVAGMIETGIMPDVFNAMLLKTNELGDILWARYLHAIYKGHSVARTSDSGFVLLDLAIIMLVVS